MLASPAHDVSLRSEPLPYRPARRSAALALLAAASAAFAPACILDFDGLTGGSPPSNGCAATPALDCGACPHECPAEGCPPITVASSETAAGLPTSLTVADGALYWVNQEAGTVMRLRGDAAPDVLTKAASPVAVAAAGGLVVWAAQDGLWGCPVEACDAKKTHLADPIGPGTIQGVALDGETVYWTDGGTVPSNTGNGKVKRCSFSSCGAAVEIGPGQQLFPREIMLLNDAVLWSVQGTGTGNGSIYKAPKMGGDAVLIRAGQNFPTAIAADATDVYWTESTNAGAVLRCPHNTGGYCQAPVEVAPGAGPLAKPVDVVIGGGRLYFGTAGDGTIRSCPLPGCGADAPLVHASGRPGLHQIALSLSCLLWTDDTGGGSVLKVAR